MLTHRPGKTSRHSLALLGSLCLFLSAVEYFIPKPLPFMRIGLANLPLLLALDIFGPGDFFLLALLKVLGQGIISGSLFSYVFLFSLAGTFSSAAIMFGMRRLTGAGFSFVGISCAGAMVSNSVQLVLARLFVFGPGLRFLAPPFLASGFVTGAALGFFGEAFCRRSRWYAQHTGAEPVPAAVTSESAGDSAPQFLPAASQERRLRRRERWNNFFGAGELFCAGLIMTLLFLFNPAAVFRIPQFVFFCFLAWFSGKKSNPLTAVLVMAGIVFFNLLAPYGRLLAQWGPLRITQGSLLSGLEKALTLEGLVMLSGACVRSDLRPGGGIGALLAESFRLLELLRQRRAGIRRGQVIEEIDRLMLELDAADTDSGTASRSPRRKLPGLLLLAAIVTVTGFFTALGFAAPAAGQVPGWLPGNWG